MTIIYNDHVKSEKDDILQNKKTILIVDDDKLLSGAIQGLLEEYGHIALCCEHGLDAIELSQERDFDLILIDYNMPGIKGDMVCRVIRYYRPDGYIVGFSSESKDRDFINAGANTFIYKGELVENLSLLHQLVQKAPSPLRRQNIRLESQVRTED